MTGRILLLLVLAGTASAQFNTGSAVASGHVRVRVQFANNDSCSPTTNVALEGNAGFTFAESSVDGQCVAEFQDVPAGNYRVRVSGADIASAETGEVALSPGITDEVEIRARRRGDADSDQSIAASAFVSVGDLGIPANAKKEFHKANQLIAKRNWEQAGERLRKAIAIYPPYAAAYNNLGAVYSHVGELGQAREALQQAIILNDHLLSAYLNLARVSFTSKDFPTVETSIKTALSLGPPTADEFKLLAYAQLKDKHFDQAIETCHHGHRSQLQHHAFLHLLSARAEDIEGKGDDSIADLRQYLKEEPAGPRAEEVRQALATGSAQPVVQDHAR